MKKSVRELLVASAMAGLLVGTNTLSKAMQDGCGGGPGKTDKATKSKKEKHACKGQNSCKGKGGCGTTKGKNDCKGKGECSTDPKHPMPKEG